MRKNPIKLIIVFIGLLFSLLYFELANFYTYLFLLIVTLGVMLRRDIWVLVPLVIPSLLVGRVLYFPITNNWMYEATLAEVFLGVAFIVLILDRYIDGQLAKIKFDKISFWLFLFLILTLASFSQVISMRIGVVFLKVVFFSFIAYFSAANLVDSKQKFLWLQRSIALTALVLAVEFFYKFYVLGWSSRFFTDRSNIIVPFGPVAVGAATLAFLLPLVLVFYYQADRKNNFSYLVCFTAGVLALFLSMGKAAIFSFLIGLYFLFIKLKEKRAGFTLFVLLATILAFLLFSSFFYGLLQRVGSTAVDKNTKFRIEEYQAGWKVIREYPYFGVGAGQQLMHFRKIFNTENTQFVNNFFLQVLIDLGIFGLGFLFFLIYRIIKKGRSILRAESLISFGVIASLIVAFFNGLAEVTFFSLSYAIIFWIVIGAYFGNYEKINSHHTQL